jgi:hypothetical protein
VADQVAPYGLTGVVKGQRGDDSDEWTAAVKGALASDPPGAGEAAARGAVQGATAGFSDEAVGGVKGGLARIVRGMYNAAHSIDQRVPQSDVDPMKVYVDARDAERGKNAAAREAHPIAFGAGEVGGGLALPGGSLAKAAGTGLVSGLGHSDTKDVGDAAAGAVTGMAGYGLAKGVGRFIKGAPARADQRDLNTVTEGVRATVANRIGGERDRVLAAIKDPEVQKALGDPKKMIDVAEQGLAREGDAADQIMGAADSAAARAAGKAGHGGMRVMDVAAPLEQFKNQLIQSSANPAAIARVETLIDQFRTGIGRDPNKLVPAAQVRQFLSEQIQRPAFKGDPMNPDTTPVQEALQRASGVVKDSLKDYVHKNLSAASVNVLQRSWDKSMALHLLSQAAEEQAVKASRAPGGIAGIAASMKEVRVSPEAAVGGMIGGLPGAIALGTAGAGVRKAAQPVDRFLAAGAGKHIGDAMAGGAPRTSTGLSQPVIDALTTKDHAAGQAALAREIFGE